MMVAAEVYRHSDGAYLECQDMFRLSGIFLQCFHLCAAESSHPRLFRTGQSGGPEGLGFEY